MEDITCPLRMAGRVKLSRDADPKYGHQCLAEGCAWWQPQWRACSVYVLAGTLLVQAERTGGKIE